MKHYMTGKIEDRPEHLEEMDYEAQAKWHDTGYAHPSKNNALPEPGI